jgi:hypothetical protein
LAWTLSHEDLTDREAGRTDPSGYSRQWAGFGRGDSDPQSGRNGEKTIRALITRNGGEKVDLSKLE